METQGRVFMGPGGLDGSILHVITPDTAVCVCVCVFLGCWRLFMPGLCLAVGFLTDEKF